MILIAALVLACFFVIAVLESRAHLTRLAELTSQPWKACAYRRSSVLDAVYSQEWTSDQLHDEADAAYFDGDLALRDLLRAAAQAVEVRERIEREQRRQVQNVRPVVQVRSLGAGA